MKVVVIDEWLPWPLDSGKKIRTFNLISRLAKQHEVLFMGYARLPEENRKVSALEIHGIKVIPVKDSRTKRYSIRFYLEVFANIFSSKPFSTWYHIKKSFVYRLLKIMRDERPDLVHCEWTNLAPFLGYVDNIPRVISAHNIESVIWRRLAKTTSNPLLKLVATQQAKRIEQLERKWYPAVDHCIAVSEEDFQVIKKYGAKVTVVENGVDIEYYNQIEQIECENTLVFTASFDTFSNQDAVDYFLQEIFPIVRRRNTKISLWLVGKDPPDRIRKYAEEQANIHVTGTVPDVRPLVSKATLCVVPLRVGGGSRLKILEAMAMKKAIISTSVGAEGLRVTDGKDILIADKPEDFANKVLLLIRDKATRRSIAHAAWKLVNSYYDWEIIARKQSQVWKSLALV